MQNNITRKIIVILLFVFEINICFALSDYYTKGLEYYYKLTPNNNEKSIEMFKIAIERKVDVALSHAALSCALIKKYGYEENKDKNLLDQAKQEAYLSLSIDAKLPQGYKALGLYYVTIDDIDRAIKEFENALKLKVDYGDCIANIGSMYVKKGNLVKAEEYYRKAIKVDPNNLFAKRVLADFYASKRGEIYLAIRAFKEILKEYPNDVNSFIYLGQIYYRMRLYDDAIEYFKKASDIEKDNKEINYYIEKIEKTINETSQNLQ